MIYVVNAQAWFFLIGVDFGTWFAFVGFLDNFQIKASARRKKKWIEKE